MATSNPKVSVCCASFAKGGSHGSAPPSPELVVIADYGSSEGHNSLPPMAAAIRAVREHVGHKRAIFVFHTDLPGNDFTALFETLANDPDSYLRNDSATFAAAGGAILFRANPADG